MNRIDITGMVVISKPCTEWNANIQHLNFLPRYFYSYTYLALTSWWPPSGFCCSMLPPTPLRSAPPLTSSAAWTPPEAAPMAPCRTALARNQRDVVIARSTMAAARKHSNSHFQEESILYLLIPYFDCSPLQGYTNTHNWFHIYFSLLLYVSVTHD